MLRTANRTSRLLSLTLTSLLCTAQGGASVLAIGLNLSCASAQQPSQTSSPAPAQSSPHGEQALLELRALQAAQAAPAAPAAPAMPAMPAMPPMPAMPAMPAAPAAPEAWDSPMAFELVMPSEEAWLDEEHAQDLQAERAELEAEIAELHAALAALERQLEGQRAQAGGGKHRLKNKQKQDAQERESHSKARAELDAARAQSIAQIQARAEALAQAHAEQAKSLAKAHADQVKQLTEAHAQQAKAYAKTHAAQAKRYAQLEKEKARAHAAQAHKEAWNALQKSGGAFRYKVSQGDPTGEARVYVTPDGKRVAVLQSGQAGGGAWTYSLPRQGETRFFTRSSDDCGDCTDCSGSCCDSCTDCGDEGCSAPAAAATPRVDVAPAAPECTPCPTAPATPSAPLAPTAPAAPALPTEAGSIVRSSPAVDAFYRWPTEAETELANEAALRPVRYSELAELLQPGAWNQPAVRESWSSLWPTAAEPSAHELNEIEELVSGMSADVRSLREELRGLRTALEQPSASPTAPARTDAPQSSCTSPR